MRTIKKIGVWLLVICMLMTQVAPVYAAGEPTLVVAEATAEAGSRVEITIEMQNNPGIANMLLNVDYDNTVLSIVGTDEDENWCPDGVIDGGLIGSYLHSDNAALCPYLLSWSNDTVRKNFTANGVIVTLAFDVAADAAPGKYPIEIFYDNENFDINNVDMETVDFAVVNGAVIIPCKHADKSNVPSKSPDCERPGNYEYFVCGDCGVVLKADGITETTVEDETIIALGHNWEAATCDAEKTCKRCGETDGDPLGHSFTNYVSNGDATCEEDGTKTAKCDRCDETDTIADAGSALGHDWETATCDTVKTCKRCGETEGSALGHSFTNYVSDENATCEEDGTMTAKCDRCDETDTIEDDGSALGHNWSDATCDIAKTCKRCGETDGDPLGHSFTNYVSNGDATCEADGTKTAKCDRCDETDTINDVGSALGHDWSADWVKDEGGHWHKCGNCFEEKDYGDHDYGDAGDVCVVCEYKRNHVHRTSLKKGYDATCIEPGQKDYYTCSGCDEWFADASGSVKIEDRASVILPKLNHSFTNYVSNGDAACEADGTKTAKCDRCDETDTIVDVGSALGHDWEAATCDTVKTCKRCGETEGDPLGHSFTNYVSNGDATCEADGTKTAKCDRCDETDTLNDVGSALGHDWSADWVKDEGGHWHKCGNCFEEKDYGDHDYGDAGDACVVCGYERNHVHRLSVKEAKNATCTDEGNKAYYTCSGCENWFEDASGLINIEDKAAVVIPALNHSFTDYVSNSDAACEADGTKTAKCDRCDETDTIDDEGSALGHSFTNYVSDENATCEEDGTKTAKCDRCDKTDTIDDVGSAIGHAWDEATCDTAKTCGNCGATEGNPLGHSFTNYISDENAECEKDGTKTAKCDRCDETDTVIDEGSALEHAWNTEWSKGEEGHWHECVNCGDKKDQGEHDFGDAGDICGICGYEREHVHRLTLNEGYDATCTAPGQKDYYTCSGCDDLFADASGTVQFENMDAIVIPALNHDWTEADCETPKTCKRCGETEGDALGHDWQEATCDDPKTCKRCGETEGDALGHDYQDGVCANCGEKDPSAEKPDKPNKPNKPMFPSWSNIIKNWFDKWWGDEEACDHVYESVVTDPTCTEKGYTTHTCEKCGDSYKDSYVNATGHDYKNNVCVDCGHKKIQKPFFGFWFDWFWKK